MTKTLKRGLPRIWAHRGASASAPENTLSSFRAAINAGADGFELDVHLSADGKLIVTHDESTDRVTGQPGRIAAMTAAAIRRLNFASYCAGAPFETAPFLEEVLSLVQGSGLTVNIELKNSVERYDGLEDAVLGAVRNAGGGFDVIYSSFNFNSMARMKQLDPDAKTGLLYVFWTPTVFYTAKRIGATAIHPHLSRARLRPYVRFAQSRGLIVNVWTVDRSEDLRRCFRNEVDAVIVNDPAQALRIRDEVFGMENKDRSGRITHER